MNGGRLSDDEAFMLGVGELRQQLQASAPDREAAERALTRIAVRYPDEAEGLRTAWSAGDMHACGPMLATVEAQHRADADED